MSTVLYDAGGLADYRCSTRVSRGEYTWLTICSECGGIAEKNAEPYRDCYGEPLPSQRLYFDMGEVLEGCDCEYVTCDQCGLEVYATAAIKPLNSPDPDIVICRWCDWANKRGII